MAVMMALAQTPCGKYHTRRGEPCRTESRTTKVMVARRAINLAPLIERAKVTP